MTNKKPRPFRLLQQVNAFGLNGFVENIDQVTIYVDGNEEFYDQVHCIFKDINGERIEHIFEEDGKFIRSHDMIILKHGWK